MKFIVDTVELNRILKSVKNVSSAVAGPRLDAHSVCLFKANPASKKLVLEFALNGSFLSYTFNSVSLEDLDDDIGEDGEIHKILDLEALYSLKFSGKQTTVDLKGEGKNVTMTFFSGRMKGQLYLPNKGTEQEFLTEIENTRPSRKESVELDYRFPLKEFKAALSAHTYGQHDDSNANKRPVRIFSSGSEVVFWSRDQKVGAVIVKQLPIPNKRDIDCTVNPSQLLTVLEGLPSELSPMFNFGVSDGKWRVNFENIDIVTPNIQKKEDAKVNLRQNFDQLIIKDSFSLLIDVEDFRTAISELTPFVSSSVLVTKEDVPIVCLVVAENEQGEDQAFLRMTTIKAKEVTQHLKDAVFENKGMKRKGDEEVYLNIKFLDEFSSFLADNQPDPQEGEKKAPLLIKWWTYLDNTMPTKGRGVMISIGENRYLTSRTNYKKMAADSKEV